MTTEPRRLRFGSDPLAASVASLQGAVPSEERMAALAARLVRAGAPLDGVPHEGPPASSTLDRPASQDASPRIVHAVKTFGPGALAVVGALVFGGGLIATAILVRDAETPITPPHSAPLVEPRAVQAPEPSSPAPSVTAVPLPSEPARARDGAPRDGRDVPATAPNDEAHLDVPSAPDAARVPPPVERSLTPSPALAPVARGEVRAPVPSARAKAPALNAGPEGAPLSANTVVESEIELLKQARSALGADPIQAYALSERCRGQYPGGAFAQEREYIAISALVRLGRESEARSRAALFRMHYPNSAYLPRLARMLGE